MGIQIGIDIGSTTAKVVVHKDGEILFRHYERHKSQVRQKTLEIIKQAKEFLTGEQFQVAISGSAGLGVSKACGIAFIQEVFATAKAVEAVEPDTDVVIELGGEDAKIIFFTNGLEERMNGSCAGGTGAFIDQMATLLNVTPDELDTLSLDCRRIYPIASRCGVFAKSDIQPLLNQGARKEDIAASIYQAVVDQTITGLAQGREIKGKVLFLGGPLFFSKGLQKAFADTLKLDEEHAVFPEWACYSVSLGAALFAQGQQETFTYDSLIAAFENANEQAGATNYLKPLFVDETAYQAFCDRHAKATIAKNDIARYSGDAYLGIDCGSTTTKLVLIDDQKQILFSFYGSNLGNPLSTVREQLMEIYKLCDQRIIIKGVAVTGYGEDLIKNAFSADAGLVETMAHFRAARHFCPDVDFILDIGGQDIKCFKVKNNAVDSIMLNEACSSGCGSFIESFAKSLGYDAKSFAKHGIYAKKPVDLGSRCTVFMNSSVKQAQKEGASVEDISAGLSISVVKNALYKVIRARSAQELGSNIVVQGGTFLNDAVLKSFEDEIGRPVIRPEIAGLMGAYGAALYAKRLKLERSTLIGFEALEMFEHTAKSTNCKLCTNHCHITVNTFANGKKFISGNKCERPLGIQNAAEVPNLFQYKLNRIRELKPYPGRKGKIGIPMGLNMLENIPFWMAFFAALDYEVVLSEISSRKLYTLGQHTIPSDTVCYPAKLMHGHIEDLLNKKVDAIFYPCMSYNFDEGKGDNHYNCPVVAYYPELLKANVSRLSETKFLYPYIALHRKADFVKSMHRFLNKYLDSNIRFKEVSRATMCAFSEYKVWQKELKAEGKRAFDYAQKNDLNCMVLAGRPYHIDPEINHGIDKLISSFGIVVLSEDAVSDFAHPQKVNVLNQWTYHARMYNAANFVTKYPKMQLIQLVSFGCGIDAVTSDEIRSLLEREGKLYTQLKIDEINNLGAVKIRIRSLLEAMEEREKSQ